MLRDLGEHLKDMEKYIGQRPFRPGMSFREKIHIWMRQGVELLSAETIAKALPELNRQILFSLQIFMVCGGIPPLRKCQSDDTLIAKLGSQIQLELGIDTIQRNQVCTKLAPPRWSD
jgi:hypothetical protein